MQNDGEMGWSRGKTGKRPVLGVGVFRDLVLGCCREGNGGEKISPHTLPEGHFFLDIIGPDQIAKNGEFRHMFSKYAHNAIISRKYSRISL
jgi:hypothetical protein